MSGSKRADAPDDGAPDDLMSFYNRLEKSGSLKDSVATKGRKEEGGTEEGEKEARKDEESKDEASKDEARKDWGREDWRREDRGGKREEKHGRETAASGSRPPGAAVTGGNRIVFRKLWGFPQKPSNPPLSSVLKTQWSNADAPTADQFRSSFLSQDADPPKVVSPSEPPKVGSLTEPPKIVSPSEVKDMPEPEFKLNNKARRRLKLIAREKLKIQKKLGIPEGSEESDERVDKQLAEFIEEMDFKAARRARRMEEREQKKEEQRLLKKKQRTAAALRRISEEQIEALVEQKLAQILASRTSGAASGRRTDSAMEPSEERREAAGGYRKTGGSRRAEGGYKKPDRGHRTTDGGRRRVERARDRMS
ncbi:hypothetical protein VTK56DRAFT_7126 [Thermocarpiscus australiensis]